VKHDRPSGRRRARAAGLAAAALLLTTACAPALDVRTAAVPNASQATVVSDFLNQTEIDFREELVMTADQGRLTSVTVTDPAGNALPGEHIEGGTQWKIPAGALDLATTYDVKVEAIDRFGTPTAQQASFTTIVPSNVLAYDFSLRQGSTYGVGMPVSISFDKPVADRAAVEERLEVTTSTPIEGRWSWKGDRYVTYRPKDYWPAGTKVSVAANLRGVEPEPGVFAVDNRSLDFEIGSSMIAVVDADTYTMTVRRNGEVIRTMPITTGKSGWETRSGIKVIMSKERDLVMDAATLGVAKDDPEYYRLDVAYAMRVTTSGEFVHSAPWSVASQGRANVSHGCVGMSTDNAAWFFNNAKIGDVVQVLNTGRYQDLGNGITVWNESWDRWVAGSALNEASAAA
jgi:lipoprotein-anchoring transpeptidase ErfK/SrfK